jgi:hypothetical protein
VVSPQVFADLFSSMINILSHVVLAGFLAQDPIAPDIPVVTVCEAILNRDRYNGKAIIVVGLLSWTFEGNWLYEDCERKIVAAGYAWPNMLSVDWEVSKGIPLILPLELEWDMELVNRKLKVVQETTKLTGPSTGPFSSHWVAMFGRFETGTPLRTKVVGNDKRIVGLGFGHLNSAPARIISSSETYLELEPK